MSVTRIAPLFFIFVLSQVYSQSDSTQTNSFRMSGIEPLFILKLQKKTIELISQTDSKLGLAAVDPNSIEEVEVLKGSNATLKYGARALYGVVVVTVKNDLGLSYELRQRFKELEEK